MDEPRFKISINDSTGEYVAVNTQESGEHVLASIHAMRTVSNPKRFMVHVRHAMKWLGRAESDAVGASAMLVKALAPLRELEDFEEYT